MGKGGVGGLGHRARARGALELVAGNLENAAIQLVLAHQRWQQLEAPYEAARLRSLLAEVHLARGDRESCLLEIRAAHIVFEQLGAKPDAERSGWRMAELIDVTFAGTDRTTLVDPSEG